ncbi:WD40-repeat-containing domain protein [Piptocephalis cylindrospora]|uniref:WD40-repeat-containing domain protein n=1 Tax=Piptocephalis cylindrospora TaxID=1907219 RepID=A0A4P9Y143_9FUNG|nr:WD40-repeat-containing domain protein [Piptocephalis cylindrospora]|eukprot:RKP11781.1 WD40-repeat-containing domain protein [Piptocephalis cylindrospora]
MISAIAWVRKGAAKETPKKFEMDEHEYARLSEKLLTARADLDSAQNMQDPTEQMQVDSEPIDPDLAEFDLENYDAPASTNTDPAIQDEDEDEAQGSSASIFGNLRGLTYHGSNQEDPYVTLKDEADTEAAEEEAQDLRILPSDNLILSARTEDDISHVEVYVYEAADDNLYVHHDLMLPAFPLCVEWLGSAPSSSSSLTQGSFVAVGTFDPEIEIWDLDVMDAMYPVAILGEKTSPAPPGPGPKKGKRSKKTLGPAISSTHHTDAIMSLAWNTAHPHLLASSSADTTVKLWDLNSSTCAHSFNHHTGKVQTVAWNPVQSTVLLTASYDRSVQCLDSRTPDTLTTFSLSSDPETARWDPHQPAHFYVATEDGIVRAWDLRQPSSPLWTLHAHDSPVSALDINPRIPGCLVTGGVDKLVKIWDIADGKPSMVLSRDLGAGKVFTAAFCPDAPQHLAVAGSQGRLNVWDMSGNPGARRAFGSRATWSSEPAQEEKNPIALADADQDMDSDDEGNEALDPMGDDSAEDV